MNLPLPKFMKIKTWPQFGVALLALWLLLLGFPGVIQAAPQDLTTANLASFYTVKNYNLGPTGMRGWMLNDGSADAGELGTMTVGSWQILVVGVGSGTPASGIMANNDVILGLSTGAGTPVTAWTYSATNDVRKSLGLAIGAAEAGDGKLNIKRWRAGVTTDVTLQLGFSNLAYSATAPYNCPKSAVILSNACNIIANKSIDLYDGHENGFPGPPTLALALLASGNTNYLAQVRTYARAIAPANITLTYTAPVGGGKPYGYGHAIDVWGWGYNGVFLAEYYLLTGDTNVLRGINQCTLGLAQGQSRYGTLGHFCSVLDANGNLHGTVPPYGPMNAASLVADLAIVIGQKAIVASGGTVDPEIPAAMDRAAKFYGYYVQKGGIPYGEHEPGYFHASNGKDSMTALMFAMMGNKPVETEYFLRMVTAGYNGREYGHTGQGFQYLWEGMAAGMGGTNAASAYLKEACWHLDLSRRSDGSFTYDGSEQYGGSDTYDYWNTISYYGIDPTATYVLTYALPKQKLLITGKNSNPTNWLSAATVTNAIWAGAFDRIVAGYNTNQLVAAMSEYDPIVRRQAAAALGVNGSTSFSMVTNLASSTNELLRAAACRTLGYMQNTAALPLLSQRLTDTNIWVRGSAAKALQAFGGAASGQVTTMMMAFANNATDPNVIDWSDPVQIANGFLSEELFSDWYNVHSYTAAANKNLLYPAVRAGLKQPDSNTRNTAAYFASGLPQVDTKALVLDFMQCAAENSQADTMFYMYPRFYSMYVLANNHVVEAMPVELGMLELTSVRFGWNHYQYFAGTLDQLATYGDAARWTLPTLQGYAATWNLDNEYQQDIDALARTIATISSAVTSPANLSNFLAVANSQVVVTTNATAITLTGFSCRTSAVTVTSFTAPAHGTLTGTAPNLTYTPAGGYVGVDSFTFRVSDGLTNSPSGTVSLIVGMPAGKGLLGSYYTNVNFTGLKFTRTDPQVNFTWGSSAPTNTMAATGYSVRWTGQLLAPETGNYMFSTLNSDGVRLYINGVQVINDWSDHALQWTDGTTVALTAGQKYLVEMDYYENTGNAVAKLKWTGPFFAGLNGVLVGSQWLYSESPVVVYEGFNYAGQSDGAAMNTAAFNGGIGLVGNWTGSGKYNTSGLTFSDLAVTGGCARFSGGSGANAYFARRPINVNKTGTIWGSCLFNSVSAIDGSTRLADLFVTKSASGTDNDGNTCFGVSPKAYQQIIGDIRLGGDGSVPTAQNNSGGTTLAQGTTYLILFKVDNLIASGGAAASQTITSWFLSAAQYDYFKSGGLTEAELNAAAQGTGATNVMQRNTLTATKKASFSVNDFLGIEAYSDIDFKIDEIRFSDANLAQAVTVPAALPVTSGLVLRMDASQLAGVANGAQVNTWADTSGLGNHAVRQGGSSAGYPMYVTSALNGKPVVRFNSGSSIGDYFQFTRISNIRTVFWVVKENAGASGSHFLLGDDSSYDFHRASANGPLWESGYASGNIKTGTTKLMGNVINGTTTSLPSASFQLVSLVTAGNVQANQICQDRVYNGSWQGDIAEILIYDRALTGAEELQVGTYLAAKYGLTAAYPVVPAPATPTGVSATPVNSGTVSVSWTTSAGATSYNVSASNTVTTAVQVISTVASPYTFTGLNNGTLYQFAVQAINANGASSYSTTVSATPMASTAKDILTFVFPGLPAPTISGTNITMTASFGTAITTTALTPTYTVSAFATGSPISGTARDFTTPQTYTITAEDGSTKAYRVTVTVSPYYLPPVTGGLVLRVDASQITNGTNGLQLGTWLDTSGAANHAVRQGGSSMGYPMYVTNVLNGKPVVRFNSGGGDSFQFTRISNIRTVFWVLKENAGATADGFLLGDSADYHFHRPSANGPLWDGGYASGNITGGTTKLMGNAINGTSTSLPSASFQVVSLVTTGNVRADQICQDRWGNNRSWQGDIAEILIYDRALTGAEELQVGTYLSAKYGLTTAYPSTAKDILTFVFPGLPAPTISGTNITMTASFGTAVTALAPTYTVSAAATGSPISGTARDFTTPQTYTITAEDGSTKAYRVTVTVSPYYLPPVTSGLVLRVDASQITGVAQSNVVSTWTDTSGAANHAVRQSGSSAGYPMYVTNVLNGQSVVRFNSGNANTGDYFQFPRITTIRTVFWVLKENAGLSDGHFLLGDSDYGSYQFHRGSANGVLWDGGYSNPNITGGTTKLMGNAINGTSTSLPSGSFQVVSLVTAGNVQANQICQDRTSHGSWQGDIAEILIYNRALTGAEELQVGSYLSSKYGLSTAYPPIPPPLTPPVLPGSAITITGGVPGFTFATAAGFKYRLTYKNALTAVTWLPVIAPPNFPSPDGWSAVSTGSPMSLSDTNSAGQPQRFYRIEAANP